MSLDYEEMVRYLPKETVDAVKAEVALDDSITHCQSEVVEHRTVVKKSFPNMPNHITPLLMVSILQSLIAVWFFLVSLR